MCHLTVQCTKQQGCATLQYNTTYLWSTAQCIEHVEKHKASEGHCGISGSYHIVTHLKQKMITNVKPTVFQQTKTHQLVSNHGVTSLKNTAVKKTTVLWYKWHLLSLTADNQFCTKQTQNNTQDWLPQQCCWRIKSSGMLWCVVGLQFLQFQRIIVPSTSGSCSPRMKLYPIWLYISTDKDTGLGERVIRVSGQWHADTVHWLLVQRGG
jgi:hypothetical protein